MYLFKHALIQDAAYQSLLKSTRQRYHQRIVQVLEAQFPETVAQQPELLAHHYTEAGLNEHAVSYWQKAGEKSAQRSANTEAITHLSKGLELLMTLPEAPERLQSELMLQVALGRALMAIRGYTAPEVVQVFSRSRELCRQLGETPQLLPVLFGLWAFYLVRGELETARGLGEEMLAMAQRVQDPSLLIVAHWSLGVTFYNLGAFVPAQAHLEQVRNLYDDQQHYSLTFLYGQDPGVTCLAWTALVLWHLGYPDQAMQRSHQALTLAQGLTHAYTLAFALERATLFYHFRREKQALREHVERLMALCMEHGFAFMEAQGMSRRGLVLVAQGQGDEGLAQIRQAQAMYQTIGVGVVRPLICAQLAEVYGQLGQVEEGLAVLVEGMALGEKTGNCAFEAELYRLKGELLLQQAIPDASQAEICFHQAIAIAQKQGAKSWELRAATSLARLWYNQGKRQEAYDLLAPVYGWFTEGFDTADLQEAKALLDDLGG
jgi:predicted ATPase